MTEPTSRSLEVNGVTYEVAEGPAVIDHGGGRIELRYRVLPPAEHIPITFVSPSTAIERGEEGTARAARRWTPEESARVDEAIRTVAKRARTTRTYAAAAGRASSEFTTADVWAELGEDFPVTKGIAAKMTAAERAGIILNTGRHTHNDHPRHDHAHGQRLTVWRAR